MNRTNFLLRKTRTRKKFFGTSQRPRLSVKRSLRHITAQIIDDTQGKTLAYVTSISKELKSGASGNIKTADQVGQLLAKKALSLGIKSIVFDRGGYPYHGCVKALADSVRKGGLEF